MGPVESSGKGLFVGLLPFRILGFFLQTTEMEDEAVGICSFKRTQKSILLGRYDLNTSRFAGLPASVQTQSSPAQFHVARGRKMAGLCHIPGTVWLLANVIWHILGSTLGLVFPMCK